MTTQPRTGMVRVGFADRIRRREQRDYCQTGKLRHASEAQALDALRRVRTDRIRNGDPDLPENHVYPCHVCEGWHLSSTPGRVHPALHQGNGESWEAYAHRLERRIAEQRAQILSMLTLGHGGTNREARKRIASLSLSLARVTELWQEERRHREALVAKLGRRRWWRRSP